MKKLLMFVFGLMMSLTLFSKAQAQEKTDYFVGKWNMLVVGTPNGDRKFVMSVERKEGKLVGTIHEDASSKEGSPITKIEEKDQTITAFFTADGYDVYLFIQKSDDNHVKGNVMDMFEASGERIVESK